MGTAPVRVAIDLETTGLNPEMDAIIEIGALKFAGDTILETFESFVSPGMSLPYRIQRLTGITPATLRNAPAMGDLLPRLRTFIGNAALVGHSVQFDAAFLRRHGLAQSNPLIDTYELASMLLPSLTSYTLGAVGVALGVSSPTFHRALADAQLSRDVLLALLERLNALDDNTIDSLDELAMPPDWTPGHFVHRARRERGGFSVAQAPIAGGTLGAQLAAKLGVNPAVLGLAIAPNATQTRPRQHVVAREPLPIPAVDPHLAETAQAAEQRLAETLQRFVAASLADGGPAVVELHNGDTGAVATTAELLRWTLTSGGRALISMGTSGAAARFVEQIVPRAFAAAEIDPIELRVAELGEREHYLCLHRWFGAARVLRDGQPPRDVSRGLAKLTVWAGQTLTGARSEVAIAGQELDAWDRVRSGVDFADSTINCAYLRDGYCFVARARENAEQARIVVTTHAALAAHLTGTDRTLPDVSRVIILDSHLLEDELRRAQSIELDRAALITCLAGLATTGAEGRRAGLFHLAATALGQTGAAREPSWFAQANRARKSAEEFFRAARAVLTDGRGESSSDAPDGSEHRTLRLDEEVRQSRAWANLARNWDTLRAALAATAKLAREAAQHVLAEHGAKTPAAADGVATDLLAAARELDRRCADGDALIQQPQDGEAVAWLRLPYPQTWGAPPRAEPSRQQRQGRSASLRSGEKPESPPPTKSSAETGEDMQAEAPVLHRAPVRVGGVLEPLYTPESGLVLAAPSLAVSGDFTYLRGSLGLPEETRSLSPASDRGEQTLLCLPTDAPEPNAPQYQRHLDEALINLAIALNGRMVVILPSHTGLRAATTGIRRALERRDILVLAQGVDGSARQLWQNFRSEPRVVLLGAGAFWEGADQTEQPPACVVVTRVPFPAFSDPLLAARSETWSDPQTQFVVPHAALRLRQALGGLAWSHWRRNSVVLFDRRLQTRSYGPTILGTLPRCTQYQETMEQIVERTQTWVDH